MAVQIRVMVLQMNLIIFIKLSKNDSKINSLKNWREIANFFYILLDKGNRIC